MIHMNRSDVSGFKTRRDYKKQTLNPVIRKQRGNLRVMLLEAVVEGKETEIALRMVVAFDELQRRFQRGHFVTFTKLSDLFTEITKEHSVNFRKSSVGQVADVMIHHDV